MDFDSSVCVFCSRTSEEVPLLAIHFRGSEMSICSQHLPVLIHEPAQLIGKLPGAEDLEPADHHD